MQKPEKSALLGFQGAVKASKQKACSNDACEAYIRALEDWHQTIKMVGNSRKSIESDIYDVGGTGPMFEKWISD